MRRVRRFLFGFICLILVMGLVPMALVVDASAPTYDGSPWDYTHASRENEWIDIDPDVLGQTSYITVAESSATHLRLEVALPGMYVYPVEMADGITYSAVSVPGSGLFELGKPAVPLFGEWILIPNSTEAEVLEVNPGAPIIFEDMELPPMQPPPRDDYEGPLPPPFVKDEEIYGADTDCPGVFAQLEPTQIMRGQDCTIIWLYPYQHNPVRRTLAVYPDLSVTVQFQGEPSPIPSRLRNESFDLMMRRMALNADEVISAEEEAEEEEEIFASAGNPGSDFKVGWDYIIITDTKFVNAANKLADWRKKTGFKTQVTTAFSGYAASDIKSGLKIAYDYWDIVPKYVLLLGDAEYIPCFYETWHPSNDEESWKCDCNNCVKEAPYRESYIGTDFYYTTMDGPNDYVPDMYIGRLSVDTASQAMKRVNDIIKYEENPVTDSSFYSNVAICTQFEDMNTDIDMNYNPTCYPDTYEDYRRAQSAEDLALFLEDPQYKIEKGIDRIYWADQNINPKYWSKHPSTFAGMCTSVGGAIPSSLLKPGFKWNGTGTDILNAVNSGRFLLVYRGHGGKDLWRAPQLKNKDLAVLNNGSKLPVVWSIACNTGWFDNESDFKKMPASLSGKSLVDYTAYNDVCFSEAWERCTAGGAVGIMASTRISFAILNDYFLEGMVQAIWPAYKLDPLAMVTPFPIFRMGEVLHYGRQHMMDKATTSTDPLFWDKKVAMCELYQWFGDPAMEIRTVTPPLIVAMVPPEWSWLLHPKDFFLHVELLDDGEQYPGPVEKATVTISKADTSDYWVGTTDEEGNVTFPGLVTSTLGEYDVVATASNCIPFQGTFVSQARSSGGIILDAEAYSCSSEVEIRLADADLAGVETYDVLVYTSGGDNETVTLSQTEMGTGMFVGTIFTASAAVVPGDGTLQVSDGDTILAEYYDEDDGTGNSALVQDTAAVDCQPPVFGALNSATLDNGCVELQWDAASDPHGLITYNIYRDQAPGPPIGSLIGSTWALSYRDCDCEPGQTYYYVVRAQDTVGNEDSNVVERSVTLGIERPPGVPTLSQWGVIGMTILFGALLVWTVRRRRLASVSKRQE
ncbi:MAG: IPTL-CTERM sorting domain-containing protein [Dehalococcoidia bacterium]